MFRGMVGLLGSITNVSTFWLGDMAQKTGVYYEQLTKMHYFPQGPRNMIYAVYKS